MISTEEFVELVAGCAGVEAVEVEFGARLGADLGLDSFALLELHAAISEAGVDLSERDWLAVGTVGELYEFCRAASTVQAPAAGANAGAEPAAVPVGVFGGLSAGAGLPGAGMAGMPGMNGGLPVSGPGGRPLPLELPGEGGERGVADRAAPEPPLQAGRFFRLVPVVPAAVPFLYELAVSPEVGFRWRYRGAVPNYAQFEKELWAGMLAQLVVESVATGEPVGNVICYNPDFALGNAYVGAAMVSRYAGSGIAVEPVRLFVRYLFDVWPFRKLYFEVPEFNFRQFSSAAGGRLRLEGRLVDHDYYQGRYWDRLILAIYRDQPIGVSGGSG